MNQKLEVDIEKAFDEGTLIDEAFEEAFHEVVRRHRQANAPLVLFRDGKVVHVDAREIKLPDDPQ